YRPWSCPPIVAMWPTLWSWRRQSAADTHWRCVRRKSLLSSRRCYRHREWLEVLSYQRPDYIPPHVGQPEIAPLKTVRQLGVVQAELVEYRRMQVVYIHAT